MALSVFQQRDTRGSGHKKDGMILFQFDTSKVTYGGNLAGNVMVGIMNSFEEFGDGCWYAIRVGITTMLAEESKPEFDASGNKSKHKNQQTK